MSKHIVVIHGHPDPEDHHFGNALAQAYSDGARAAGHEVRDILVAALDFPLLRSADDFYYRLPPPSIVDCQKTIAWADHIAVFFPLWQGDMPALLKGFFEQVFRPAFALPGWKEDGEKTSPDEMRAAMDKMPLKGKSARLVVTMGMPALMYRFYFGEHSVKSVRLNLFGIVGIKPVRETLIGLFDAQTVRKRTTWLERARSLGGRAA